MAPRKLPQPIPYRGRPGQDRFTAQMVRHILSQFQSRVVAARAILFQRLHHDPVEIAANQFAQDFNISLTVSGHLARLAPQRTEPCRWRGRIDVLDQTLQILVGSRLQSLSI